MSEGAVLTLEVGWCHFLEILRLAFAWGICALVVLFWYYVMSRLGTF